MLDVHLIIDAPAAMAMREPHPDTRRAVFLTDGIATFVVRNVSTAIGAFAGKSLGNIAALADDAAMAR
jgi:predicted branched-subunit amino acid permease